MENNFEIKCDQCEPAMINGVFCHEIGCPNQGSRFDSSTGDWIKQRVCNECGCTVDADDECCDAELDSCWDEDNEPTWEDVTLLDDGTMDTVVEFDGEEIRYSDTGEYRDETGAFTIEGWKEFAQMVVDDNF